MSLLMILLKISQHLQLSQRGSKTGLVINAPVKYAANYSFFCIKYIFLVTSWCEFVFYYTENVNPKYPAPTPKAPIRSKRPSHLTTHHSSVHRQKSIRVLSLFSLPLSQAPSLDTNITKRKYRILLSTIVNTNFKYVLNEKMKGPF